MVIRQCTKNEFFSEFTETIKSITDNDGVTRHSLALYVAYYRTVSTSASTAVAAQVKRTF